jgi:hypothetical protein
VRVDVGDVVQLSWLSEDYVALTSGGLIYLLPVDGPYNLCVCLRAFPPRCSDAVSKVVAKATSSERSKMMRWFSNHRKFMKIDPFNDVMASSAAQMLLRTGETQRLAAMLTARVNHAKRRAVNRDAPPLPLAYRYTGRLPLGLARFLGRV